MLRKWLLTALAICWTVQPIRADEPSPAGTEKTPPQAELLVVLLSDGAHQDQCPWQLQVRSILKELKAERSPRVSFVELDTSVQQYEGSLKKAEELGPGVKPFMLDFIDFVPYVGLFRKGKLIKELPGPKTKSDYARAIDNALERQ